MRLIVAGSILFLCGLVWNKSKIIFFLQITWMWLVMGWNSGGIDYSGNMYIFLHTGGLSKGFIKGGWLSSILAAFFNKNATGFREYNIFIVGISALVLAFVILQESRKPCLVMNCFFLYPFLDSIMQKRFFPGMVFVILGFYFLQRNKRLLYAICIIIALGFHFSFIIYFGLILLQTKKEIGDRIVFLSLLFEIIFLEYGNQILGLFFSKSKLNRYLFKRQYSSNLIGIIYLISLLLYIIIFFLLSHSIVEDQEDRKKIIFVNNLNKISVILLPLCLYESVFLRYYRPVMFYEYIVISNIIFERNEYGFGTIILDKKRIITGAFFMYLVIVNIGIYSSASVGIGSIFRTMLDNAFFR